MQLDNCVRWSWVLVLGATLLAAPARAEPLTCQGRAVTIEGNTGTAGDDVMVVDNGVLESADTGAGNDLVCIRTSTAREPYWFNVHTGPGDDTVHNETTSLSVRVTVVLGAGQDSYLGSDIAPETVVAGSSTWQRLGDTTDVETDTIRTGGAADAVYTGSTAHGVLNPDVVDTGEGDDTVHWAGEQVGPPVGLGGGQNSLAVYPG